MLFLRLLRLFPVLLLAPMKKKPTTKTLNKKIQGVAMDNKHLTNQSVTFEGDNGYIHKITRHEQESSNDWNRRYNDTLNSIGSKATRAHLFDGVAHEKIYFN